MGLEDELRGISILLQFTVDPGPDGEVLDVGDAFLGDDGWSQRTEVVHRFT